MKYALWIGASVASLCIAFFVVALVIAAVNQYRLDSKAHGQELEQTRQRLIAEADVIGGASPAETLTMFAETVRAKDVQAAAALCVPALRDHVKEVIGRLTDADAVRVAAQLREAALQQIAESGEAVTLTEPVYVGLVRYPSNIWKIASL